jgi:RimJ/RimL family protein N-acetyltransferase
MIKFLEGNQVYLRPLTIEDANEIYLKWLNNAEVTRGLASGYFPITQQELINYVNGALGDQNTIFFALCEKESNRHIGNVKVDRIDWMARNCELGLIIGEDAARGRGLGFESMNLVIQYIFEDLNLNNDRDLVQILEKKFQNRALKIHSKASHLAVPSHGWHPYKLNQYLVFLHDPP